MEVWLSDLRHTIRQLARNRGFTAAAVLTLALGLGANSAIFSVTNAMRLVPQRFERPEELVFLRSSEPSFDAYSNNALDWLDWRDRATSFGRMALFHQADAIVTGAGEPRTSGIVRASADMWSTLGVAAQIGRLPRPEEEALAAQRVAVLTDGFWRRAFTGQRDILGRSIEINDVPHTIIGVLPPDLQFGMLWRGAEIFTQLTLEPARLTREGFGYWSIARLRPGISVTQAQAEIDGIMAGLAEAYPESNGDRRARVQPMAQFFFSADDKIAMGAAMLAVFAVLLIACVNLANLTLARATARGGEFAVRAALGAGRRRIVQQLLTESLTLALLGGGLGLLVGQWVVSLFNATSELAVFRPAEVGPNAAVLGYTFVAAVSAALVFGLTPGLAVSRQSMAAALKGAGASAGRSRTRLRDAVVVAQLALTLPLLITCAMAMRQLVVLETLDFGFDTDNLLTFQLDVPAHRYEDPHRWSALFDETMTALRATPGIETAGAALGVPVGTGGRRAYEGEVAVEGAIGAAPRPDDVRGYEVVTPDYFGTLGVELVAGRFFALRDSAEAPPVAIVNRSMAQHYWDKDDPIGKRFTFDPNAESVRWISVVGVVDDFGADFWGEPLGARLYLPLAQRPHARLLVVVRTVGVPREAIAGVRAAVRDVDEGMPVYAFRTIPDHIDTWLNETRVVSSVVGGTGLLALGLASVGLFGMMSYSVLNRTREIGVRVALGANRASIMGLVFGSTLRLATRGIAVGLLLSLAAGGGLLSMMYRMEPPQPTTVLGVLVLLIAVVVVAAYVPARRATAIDPLVALRTE